MSFSATWPIATESDSDGGLRDTTFLRVSWKIAGWMSKETKINLSSWHSCISTVRNQRRTVGMKVIGNRSHISLPSCACHWWVQTSLHFPFLYKLLTLTSLQTLTKDISWHPEKQIASSPSSHCWKRPETWHVPFTGEENTRSSQGQYKPTPSQQHFLSPRGETLSGFRSTKAEHVSGWN